MSALTQPPMRQHESFTSSSTPAMSSMGGPAITDDMQWKNVAKAMQQYRDDTIAAVTPPVPHVPAELPLNVTKMPSELLTKDEITITTTTPEALVSAMAKGEMTSSVVVNAFLRRAGLAAKLVNCVTELLPQRALDRAKFLDEYLARTGKPIGPLHGLPISVKEHVSMKGLTLNAGFISWAKRVASEDALILTLLWNAGAVFYVRTTQPQTLMHLDTSSNLYGVTVNPYNRNLTSGGSSGGEGALLGMRASCMGIGTDIGGSIRNPAANNGVFGYKPTTFRLPTDGLAATMGGSEHIVCAIGPFATSLEGIKMFMKTLIDQSPWLYDPKCLPFPWRDTKQTSLIRTDSAGKRKLKVGILVDDGVVKPHPPILRALDKIKASLAGNDEIEVVEFPPYKHDEAWRIISSLYFADGAGEESDAINSSGEPWRPLSKFIIKENPNVKNLSIPDAWKLQAERDAYKKAYTAHWNSVSGSVSGGDMVDVILCPVGPGAAPPVDCARWWGYTSQWNLLDYPSLVFPTGLSCTPEVDVKDESYSPRNSDDEYNHKLYEPETYRDAPISLQLVGRRYEDEKVMEAMEMLIQAAGLPSSV